ncbi:MAG: DNA recombination protein RmuC [Limnohabitans sp.]|nr:DNA recombination protein RmuC [Limnohabitans sp.]
MDIISILIGLLVGFVISYIIFNLLNKSKNVPKADFELLTTKFNETNTQMKVSEDRLSSQQQEISKLNSKFDARENEITGLLSKTSSLETTVKNNEEKISELTKSLSEQTNSNSTLQNEVNSLKQSVAEEKANNSSLADNLKSQKETNSKQSEEIVQANEKIIKLTAENSSLTAINSSLTENYNSLKETSKKQEEQITKLTELNNKLNSENSTLIANNSALTEKLSTQKEEIIDIQKTSHLQFEKIANQILEEKSGKFTEANKTNIEALLKPLGENLDNFKKKVEETYDKESKQRFSLEEKVKELVEQTNKVSSEANNLATALKGQAKKQGNWGEMILESILQKSGLVKDREYFLQATIKDEEGKNLRPDVLVKLPDNRIIIIDSKVSLVAYDRFSSADTTDEQALHLAEHLKSIYGHIDDLNEKKYDNLEASLDFTMMFVPIEPAYLISIQSDQDLWAYAYSKRILLISPTNLIACLKLMADLWKREMQSKNAMDIVKRGELLYEKFVTFVSTLEDVGKHINKTQQSYTAAIGQLNTGSGHLVGQALKLKNLGLKSSKEIPAALLPTDFEAEVIIEPKQIEE